MFVWNGRYHSKSKVLETFWNIITGKLTIQQSGRNSLVLTGMKHLTINQRTLCGTNLSRSSGTVWDLMFHCIKIIYIKRSPSMYVCMSENLYLARLKQSHRCAAVSNKQKCLQCPFETFSGQVDWAQRGWKAVPNPCSGNSKTPIAECTVGMWNDERRSIRRPKSAPAGVSDELTVVSKVRWQLTEERLMDQQRQLELYTLPDWQPMEPTKCWRYVLATASTCDEMSCRSWNMITFKHTDVTLYKVNYVHTAKVANVSHLQFWCKSHESCRIGKFLCSLISDQSFCCWS